MTPEWERDACEMAQSLYLPAELSPEEYSAAVGEYFTPPR